MKNLYIIGAGGFGREVAWLTERINNVEPTWRLCGFLDDTSEKQGTVAGRYPVVGSCAFLEKMEEKVWVICAGTILTVDITIGRHVIINLDCTVGHDAHIED